MEKINRKRKRFAARLKSSKGIICTETETLNIIICNAGQATGLDKHGIEQLITVQDLHITCPKFIAEKGESYSFLVFSSISEAVLFYNTCNGRITVSKNGPPLYLSFVENFVVNEIRCLHKNPKGLTLIDNFISEEEESEFISLFDWIDKSNNLKNRQVKHYGFEFRYGSNDVDLNCPLAEKIPEECDVLWKRLREKGFDLGVPDQLTVNKYEPGQGIPSHVDKHSPFGSTILSVSLGSSVVMDWKHHSGKFVPLVVPARSILVMQDEARYDWQHGIQPRTWDPVIKNCVSDDNKPLKLITSDTVLRKTRISLTFRWTRLGPCQCIYKTLCDSVESGGIENSVATNLEELHVHQVYEKIAGHFSATRHKPWPKVVEFMEQVPPGSIVLDLGCGNGKNILDRDDIFQIGGERSSGLLEECKQQASGVARADYVRLDVLQAGLRARCADAVICIAVIHHFSTKVRRQQSISTIAELLRPGGRALITVWAKDQTKSNYLQKAKTTETNSDIVSVGTVSLPVHENRTQFQHSDLLVPWNLRGKLENKLADKPESTLLRYYHVFEEGELENLCKEIPDITVERSFYEQGNWCIIFRKIH